jgi:ketosteroid isomerase-like protein
MTEQVLELVHRAYESWNSDGLAALEPWLADRVELSDAPELPDSGTFQGRDAVLARLEEVAATMGGGWADLRDFRAFEDEVLVSMVWQADDTASGAAFGEVFHVVRVAGGQITRVRVFLEERAALEALRR